MRFNPTKKEIETSLSQAQSHLSEARRAIREDDFHAALGALGGAEREVSDTADLVQARWAAIDHHREELMEYHRRELEKLANAPDAVNESPKLRSVE